MSFKNLTRANAASALVLLAGLYTTFQLLRPLLLLDGREIGSDELSTCDKRFAAIRDKLPPRGTIGYLFQSSDWKRWDYSYAQYSLVPLILDKNPDHPLVLGYFPPGVSSPPILTNSNYFQIEDFGNGVFLFTNKVK
jgi:hypothetical protein